MIPAVVTALRRCEVSGLTAAAAAPTAAARGALHPLLVLHEAGGSHRLAQLRSIGLGRRRGRPDRGERRDERQSENYSKPHPTHTSPRNLLVVSRPFPSRPGGPTPSRRD